ncbi:UDP-N-acetylmuramoyl-L-alanyl-D-glutamate--2,6-diaminopimelate ligase [Candidatus Microgenomates bacterium]|nr:MAG: UDP-N-acetylmuramoyl-L-alanyl-D-glutamate--2,6-diaminopimelate ligase [Candidatus Microgenomates bacterium]
MFQRIKNIYHLFTAVLANIWFGFPSKKLTVIGVTGTDGKTTTVNIIYHILKEAGFNASVISSVGAIINGKKYDVGFHVTTPSSWMIQGFMKKASLNSNNPSFLVLEVTSHALDQYRVWGTTFAVGALTNITHEHLDYHKTYENYVLAKAKLLNMAKSVVINIDDNSYKFISKIKDKILNNKITNKKWITYGKSNGDITLKNFPFETKIIGEFNKYNIMAAIGVCRQLGIGDEDIRKGINTFNLPVGREEMVYDKEFKVMVDFAHTPNALENILSSVKPEIKGRFIHVFGSAGERDCSKRPLMGRISARYSNIIVLTSEDSRSEPVEKIMEEIEKGIKDSEFKIQDDSLFKIPDRQAAIKTAIKMARKGDFVLITGKGHEKSMNLGKGEEEWSEYKAVKKALEL